MIARRRLHSVVFIAAGIYNIVWGVGAAIDPQWLFRYAGMPLQNYPEIFACLGMANAGDRGISVSMRYADCVQAEKPELGMFAE